MFLARRHSGERDDGHFDVEAHERPVFPNAIISELSGIAVSTISKAERGDSLDFDSAVGHVYLSTGAEDAEVLVCCVDNDSHRLPATL